MYTYVADGSTKKIVLGAGVVEILPSGFIKTHCFHTYHAKPTTTLCEVYAFNAAFKYFWGEISKDEKDEYLNEIKRKVLALKKCVDFSVKKKNESVEELAHHLSRTYMNDELCGLLFNEENKNKDSLI
ncbi:hypothetical protein COA01_23110 [Bacillus cereus]|uniref:hypothetical protein n=1 Tax=Bacillus cereus TaxID=1396 RepID=UPI000BFC64D9|nr:hypothetical protein [Bacillus cereus]PGP18635.1 hypothetical protein COA01_23110 [Bacillus cereus]